MRCSFIAATSLFVLMLGAATVNAAPCASPRDAAAQFLDNLQPEQFRPKHAIRCFQRPSGLSEEVLIQRVRDFKSILDARGLWVVMDDLPNDANFKNAKGFARVKLVSGFADFEIRKYNNAWLFPESIIERVPRLYADTFSSWVEETLSHAPPAFRIRVLGHEVWQLIAICLLLAISLLVGRLTRFWIVSRLVFILKRWHVKHAGRVLAHAAKPLGLLTACGLFALALPELRLPVGTSRLFTIILRLIAAVAAVTVTYRFVDVFALRLEAHTAQTESRLDDQLVVLVRKALRVLVVSIGAVFILQNLNIDVSSLLAGLGIGGLALALAAKDTAANLFGSVTIFVDAPFYVGDWINAAGVEGTVTEIGLRSTRVRTFYDSEVSIPNSKLAATNIDNFSRRVYRRFNTRIGVTYDTTPEQVQAFVEGIRALVAAHPYTRKDYHEIHLVEFGASAMEIMVYVFFQVDAWSKELEGKHTLLLSIKRLAATLEIEFAFPTQTLHLASVAAATERPPTARPNDEELTATVLEYGPGGQRSQPLGQHYTHGFLPVQTIPRGADEDGG